MKKKYSKPTLKSRKLECSRHILADSNKIDMTPEGGKGGDWNAGAKDELEDTEFIGW